MIGVSTACLYPLDTEVSLRFLAENGVKTIEVFINTFSEFKLDYIRSLKQICDRYGVQVYSIHPFTSFMETYFFFDDYVRRKSDGLYLYESFFEASSFLGAKVFNFHGQLQQAPDCEERYLETYSELYGLAKKYGLKFSQENVRNYKSRDIAFIRKMVAQLGDQLDFTLDINQAHMAGQDIFEMAEAMSNRLSLVHINDFDEEHDCMLPLCGICDLYGLHKNLSNSGFSGPYMIEVYSSNYRDRKEILNSKGQLEKIFDGKAG